MKNVMTYGEIQYYLYDGDKKEKKVTRDSFMNSKDVAVNHYEKRKKRKTTTSHTGKVIESFDLFCEMNGPNLALNYNTDYDFRTYQGKSFDGGDGASGTEVPDKFKQTIKDKKIDRGHQENKERKQKRKENSKEYRIAKMMDYQTTDDIIKPGVPEKQPTTHA
jgi:hypothetical protein